MFGNCHGSHAISVISLWVVNFYIRFTLRTVEVSYETILLSKGTLIVPSPYEFSITMPAVHADTSSTVIGFMLGKASFLYEVMFLFVGKLYSLTFFSWPGCKYL